MDSRSCGPRLLSGWTLASAASPLLRNRQWSCKRRSGTPMSRRSPGTATPSFFFPGNSPDPRPGRSPSGTGGPDRGVWSRTKNRLKGELREAIHNSDGDGRRRAHAALQQLAAGRRHGVAANRRTREKLPCAPCRTCRGPPVPPGCQRTAARHLPLQRHKLDLLKALHGWWRRLRRPPGPGRKLFRAARRWRHQPRACRRSSPN